MKSHTTAADEHAMRRAAAITVILIALAGVQVRAQGTAPEGPEELPLPRPVMPGIQLPQPAEPLPLPPPGPLVPGGVPPRSGDMPPCLVMPGSRLKELLAEFRAERDALEAAYTTSVRDFETGLGPSSGETALLRLRIKEALNRLARRRTAKKVAPPAPTPAPAAKKGPATQHETSTPVPAAPPNPAPPEPEEFPLKTEGPALEKHPRVGPGRPVDPLALGQTLFRVGKYAEALKAFESIDLRGSVTEARAPVQYLKASCLRHLGKADEAAALYREVANARGDEQLAACARWQLSTLRWQRETATRLEEIRRRRQALETSAP